MNKAVEDAFLSLGEHGLVAIDWITGSESEQIADFTLTLLADSASAYLTQMLASILGVLVAVFAVLVWVRVDERFLRKSPNQADFGPGSAVFLIASFLFVGFCVYAFTESFRGLVQITQAPNVWLIEYAQNLLQQLP